MMKMNQSKDFMYRITNLIGRTINVIAQDSGDAIRLWESYLMQYEPDESREIRELLRSDIIHVIAGNPGWDVVANGGPFQVISPPHYVLGMETIDEPIYVVRQSELSEALKYANSPK